MSRHFGVSLNRSPNDTTGHRTLREESMPLRVAMLCLAGQHEVRAPIAVHAPESQRWDRKTWAFDA
jgi:hypothetical protein